MEKQGITSQGYKKNPQSFEKKNLQRKDNDLFIRDSGLVLLSIDDILDDLFHTPTFDNLELSYKLINGLLITTLKSRQTLNNVSKCKEIKQSNLSHINSNKVINIHKFMLLDKEHNKTTQNHMGKLNYCVLAYYNNGLRFSYMPRVIKKLRIGVLLQ